MILTAIVHSAGFAINVLNSAVVFAANFALLVLGGAVNSAANSTRFRFRIQGQHAVLDIFCILIVQRPGSTVGSVDAIVIAADLHDNHRLRQFFLFYRFEQFVGRSIQFDRVGVEGSGSTLQELCIFIFLDGIDLFNLFAMIYAAVISLADIAPVGMVGGTIHHCADFAGFVFLGTVNSAASFALFVLGGTVNSAANFALLVLGGAINRAANFALLVLGGTVNGAANFALLVLLAAVIGLTDIAPVLVTGAFRAAALFARLDINHSSMIRAAIVLTALAAPIQMIRSTIVLSAGAARGCRGFFNSRFDDFLSGSNDYFGIFCCKHLNGKTAYNHQAG